VKKFLSILLFIITSSHLLVAQDDVTPTFSQYDCPAMIPTIYDVRCGIVSVVENRQNNDENMIDIHLYIFRGRDYQVDNAPLMYLSGGPGGAALPFSWQIAQYMQPLWRDRDFIFFDQRGTGLSGADLMCDAFFDFSFTQLSQPFDNDLWEIQLLETITPCFERYIAEGIPLEVYNSQESASDISDILDALGYEQAHLWGISYGTRLALTTIRDHPQRVASAILDGLLPPEVDTEIDAPISFYNSLQRYFLWCELELTCLQTYSGLEARFFEKLEQLNESPEQIEIFDAGRGETINIVVSGNTILNGLDLALSDTQAYGQLLRPMQLVTEGNYDYFVRQLLQSLNSQPDVISIGQYFAVMCHDEFSLTQAREITDYLESIPTIIQDYFRANQAYYAICDRWINTSNNAIELEPVVSDIPTLLFSGEADNLTPPIWGDSALQNLSNGQHIIFPYTGHAVTFERECVLDLAQTFLANPMIQLDRVCAQMIPSPIKAN